MARSRNAVRRLAKKAVKRRMRALRRGKALPKKCSRCGGDNKVKFIPDPFDSQLHSNWKRFWLCDDCKQSSKYDI